MDCVQLWVAIVLPMGIGLGWAGVKGKVEASCVYRRWPPRVVRYKGGGLVCFRCWRYGGRQGCKVISLPA